MLSFIHLPKNNNNRQRLSPLQMESEVLASCTEVTLTKNDWMGDLPSRVVYETIPSDTQNQVVNTTWNIQQCLFDCVTQNNTIRMLQIKIGTLIVSSFFMHYIKHYCPFHNILLHRKNNHHAFSYEISIYLLVNYLQIIFY